MSTRDDNSVSAAGISEIDRRYGRALFLLVSGGDRKADRMLAVQRALDMMAATVEEHESLRRVLGSRRYGPGTRASVSVALGEAVDAPEEVISFVRLLALRGRSDRLVSIAAAYRRLVADSRGALRVDVYTARPIASDRSGDLKSTIAGFCGKGVDVVMHVDPAMIGGVRMRMGSRVVDASIRGRIDRIAQHLYGN